MGMETSGFALIDIDGLELTKEDAELLAHPQVAGMILFAHNFDNPRQLSALISSVRKIKPNCIVTTDHEGGRVQRFLSGFSRLPSASHYGNLYETGGMDTALSALAADHSTAAKELLSVGINVNLAPMLDLGFGNNTAVKERCFHHLADVVTELSGQAMDAVQSTGLFVTAKHFPGHGWVSADSHVSLPYDTRTLDEITAADLVPFMAHRSRYDWLMPAHIVFSQVDTLPITFSKVWLQEYLRDKWSYPGVIVSDDLSMQACREMGTLFECSEAALKAGCDLVLMCNDRKGVIETLGYFQSKAYRHQSVYLNHFMQRLEKQLQRETLC